MIITNDKGHEIKGKGLYLAEITRELFRRLEKSKYQFTEYRLSIYGRKMSEWDTLSKWVMNNNLISKHNKWMIQIPRIYPIHHKGNSVKSFQEMLDNIFKPLFEVTLNPESNPKLAEFLENVSGFDSVDDESRMTSPADQLFSKIVSPKDWTTFDNPSFKYYVFYLHSNIKALNLLRKAKNMSTFDFRPHAGEAGNVYHLHTTFLLCDGINHGINLIESPSLLYLYYLEQIGLAVSPMSNNKLFVPLIKNPFPTFFKIGMNVSLSTDDPLMFHMTRDPMMEEYSMASNLWRFTTTDQCEIARNSVLQSGFDDKTKRAWLGVDNIYEENNIKKDNVPDIRMQYRRNALAKEKKFVGLLDL